MKGGHARDDYAHVLVVMSIIMDKHHVNLNLSNTRLCVEKAHTRVWHYILVVYIWHVNVF